MMMSGSAVVGESFVAVDGLFDVDVVLLAAVLLVVASVSLSLSLLESAICLDKGFSCRECLCSKWTLYSDSFQPPFLQNRHWMSTSGFSYISGSGIVLRCFSLRFARNCRLNLTLHLGFFLCKALGGDGDCAGINLDLKDRRPILEFSCGMSSLLATVWSQSCG